MEHVHSIIIIKNGDKFLNYFDDRWGVFFFPNIRGNDLQIIKKMYNTDKVKYLFDKVHDKYSVSHNETRTYHHYFYEVDTKVDGKYFSLDELLKDSKTKMHNGDVIEFIRQYYDNNVYK